MKALLLSTALTISIMSQVEIFPSIIRVLMYVTWLLLVVWSVIKRRGKIIMSHFEWFFLLAYIAFFVYCVICSIGGKAHIHSRYLTSLIPPLIVSFIGYNFRDELTEENIKNIIYIYIFASLIFAIWVHITYFPSYSSWLEQSSYAFLQKNSAAQIWGSSILLILFYLELRTQRTKIIGYSIALYLFLIIAICQCRTAIIGVCFSIIAYIIFRSKRKILMLALLIGIIMVLWNMPISKTFIEQALMINNYGTADLNRFSAGRLDNYKFALELIAQNPIIGSGDCKVDCFYISVWAETGIIGLIIISSIWIMRIKKNIFYLRSRIASAKGKNILVVLTTFYFIESLFEGLPPFGPGVSSAMFWLLCAILVQ